MDTDRGSKQPKQPAVVPPVGGDKYRRRFGEVALDLGFVSSAQLYEALSQQARRKADGKKEKLLGQILIELGYLQADQVQKVLDILYPVDPDS